jgi:hypothetical protein
MPDDADAGSEIITFMGTMTVKPEHEEAHLALAKATAETIRCHEPDTLLESGTPAP